MINVGQEIVDPMIIEPYNRELESKRAGGMSRNDTIGK